MRNLLILLLCAFVLSCKSTRTATTSSESQSDAVSQAQWHHSRNFRRTHTGASPPFHLIAVSSHSGVRTHPQPLMIPTIAIHRATAAPPTRQSLPLRTATLRTLSVASRAQHHIPPMASRQQSLKEHLPPPSAVIRRRSKSTDYTFPIRKRRSP